MRAKKMYFKDCNLAGRHYYDCDEVFDELRVGTLLRMCPDPENHHDQNAVALFYDKVNEQGEKDEFLLGYIPRTSNEDIAAFLAMGWTNLFECRISKISPDEHYERQIMLTIRIKRNE